MASSSSAVDLFEHTLQEQVRAPAATLAAKLRIISTNL
jgi:hypothetical protein